MSKFSECSGKPYDCPENEGYGCCNMILKPFQVGETDIVAAHTEHKAVEIFKRAITGYEDVELEVFELPMDMKLQNEDGSYSGELLGDIIKKTTKPEYLFGWE